MVNWIARRSAVALGLAAGAPAVTATFIILVLTVLTPASQRNALIDYTKGWPQAAVVSAVLLAAGAVVVGWDRGPLARVIGRGSTLGAVAITLVWISWYVLVKGGAGDYEGILEGLSVIFAPVALVVGTVAAALLSTLTRVIRGVTTKPA